MLEDFEETFQGLLGLYHWNWDCYYKNIEYQLEIDYKIMLIDVCRISFEFLNYQWKSKEIVFKAWRFSIDFPKFFKPLSVKFQLL